MTEAEVINIVTEKLNECQGVCRLDKSTALQSTTFFWIMGTVITVVIVTFGAIFSMIMNQGSKLNNKDIQFAELNTKLTAIEANILDIKQRLIQFEKKDIEEHQHIN